MRTSPTSAEPSLLVGQPEACRLLGVSKRTLHALIAAGRLNPVVLSTGGFPRIRRSEIDLLVAGADSLPGRAAPGLPQPTEANE